MISPALFSKIKAAPVRKIISALEKDGFSLIRAGKKGNRIYAHEDGRMTVIHFHHSNDTLLLAHCAVC